MREDDSDSDSDSDRDDDLDASMGNQDDLEGSWEAELAEVSPEDQAALEAFTLPLDQQVCGYGWACGGGGVEVCVWMAIVAFVFAVVRFVFRHAHKPYTPTIHTNHTHQSHITIPSFKHGKAIIHRHTTGTTAFIG